MDTNILTIIGIPVGIFGIILSIIFYFKGIRAKQPLYKTELSTVIKDNVSSINNLKILFKDTPIKNLTVCQFFFWNNGKETIDHEDIETIDPIRIVNQKSAKILDISIIKSNLLANNFSVNLDKKNNCVFFLLIFLITSKVQNFQFFLKGKNQMLI